MSQIVHSYFLPWHFFPEPTGRKLWLVNHSKRDSYVFLLLFFPFLLRLCLSRLKDGSDWRNTGPEIRKKGRKLCSAPPTLTSATLTRMPLAEEGMQETDGGTSAKTVPMRSERAFCASERSISRGRRWLPSQCRPTTLTAGSRVGTQLMWR
jgi:hypothetical protein